MATLVCAECGKHAPEHARGWRALVGYEPEEEPDTEAVYVVLPGQTRKRRPVTRGLMVSAPRHTDHTAANLRRAGLSYALLDTNRLSKRVNRLTGSGCSRRCSYVRPASLAATLSRRAALA